MYSKDKTTDQLLCIANIFNKVLNEGSRILIVVLDTSSRLTTSCLF
jgi:hypothetical protein